jgi:hypothetical protein
VQRRGGGRVEVCRGTGANGGVFHPANGIVQLIEGVR